jgi:hypothetical protein
MTYGPFDLSDAGTAEVSFWLWRQLETDFDYVRVCFSHDNLGYSCVSWSGTAGWEEMHLSLDNYIGDNTVWIAWVFQSNYAIQYEGPWVDDILIRKYVPGQVTPQGTFSYFDRLNNSVSARYMNVSLYDADPGGTDDPLGTTTTDANGFFQFPTRINWDDDDTDPDPNNRRLDLYVVWEADYADNGSTHHRVTNLGGQTYKWQSSTHTNAPDGTVDFSTSISTGSTTLPAMWIFQDLRRAWEYIRNHTSPQFDPGSVTAKWENLQDCYPSKPFCSSFFDGGAGGTFIFISHPQRISVDTVVHETGHHYVYNATGWWLWDDPWCYNHDVFSQESSFCAWSEGWADFLPLAMTAPADQCYDKLVGPCTGAVDSQYYNLETHGRGDQYPWGDTLEGRVAGALYDLFDSTNEGYDSAAVGFDPITDIVFQESDYYALYYFWVDWKSSGQNKHHALRAIYQNTIDYDTLPRFSPLLPDRNVLQNHPITHAIDLWAYTTDDESGDSEVTYSIVNLPDWHCGIALVDGHWINILPQSGWLGSCGNVVVRVNDSLHTADDTFVVTIVPVQGTVNMPLIMK